MKPYASQGKKKGLMFNLLERGLPAKRPEHPTTFLGLMNRLRGQASLQQVADD